MCTAVKGTALIAGASSGIGAVYAEGLAHRSYDLILVARRRQRLDTIASRLGRDTGGSVKVAPLIESGIAKMDRIIDLNVKARVPLTHALAPAILRRKTRSIVNIAPELLNGVKGGAKAFGYEMAR
jgi:short-subunit dehydrogenase